MTENQINSIINSFGPCCMRQGPCLLIWQRNSENVGLLIDSYGNRFWLVRKNPYNPFVRDRYLETLFNGFIYEDKGRLIFNFEYQYSKTSKYILNVDNRFAALRTILTALHFGGVSPVLTFSEDVKKIEYRYSNNTFWNPERKRYYTLNAKYDEHARTGRYNKFVDRF